MLTQSCVARVRHMVGVSRSKEERLLTLSLLSFKTTIQMPVKHKYKSSPEQRLVFAPKFRDELFSGAEQLLRGQSAFSTQPQTAAWGTVAIFEIVL